MSVLTIPQAIVIAKQAGFTGSSAIRIVAIGICESGLDTSRRGVQDPRDRGWLQINSFWHPEVSDSCAFNALCSAQAAFRISANGTNFNQWTTFTNGCSNGKMALVQSQAGSMISPTIGSNPANATPGKVVSIPLWCKPFMAKSMQWWETSGYHYPQQWANAEGGVDWTPSPKDADITVLLSGMVVGSGYFCKPGHFQNLTWQECTGTQGFGVVTIRSPNPRQDLVPGQFIDVYYQHIKIDPSIGLTVAGKSGQRVTSGQKIGTGNGLWNIEMGVNVGTEWGAIWGGKSPGPHVDPIPFLYAIISQGITGGDAISGTGSSGAVAAIKQGATTLVTVGQQAYQLINHVEGFQGICESMDLVEQFVPFTLPTQVQQDINTVNQPQSFNVFGWNTGVPNPWAIAGSTQAAIQLPADSMQAILVFTTTNFLAFAVRSLFVVVGMILFFALMINLTSKFVDIKDVGKVAEGAMALM